MFARVANDPIDELRRTAYPNPERIGCHGPEVFEALRQKRISFDDPIWKHIERCSPCYGEFAAIRDELFREEWRGHVRKLIGASMAVIALVVAGVITFVLFGHREHRPNLVASTNHTGTEAAVLNLKDGSELRGASSGNRSCRTIRLPAFNTCREISCVLPFFFPWEVRLERMRWRLSRMTAMWFGKLAALRRSEMD